MLVTITATQPPGAEWPATDLGYLLAKNPAGVQDFSHGFGRSRVFYPEAGETLCTAALYVEIDPIGLIKSRNLDSADFSLSQYVNDRPYAATSLLAGAIGQVFRTAIRGTSKDRPELAATAIPLTLHLPVVPAAEAFVTRVFEPLGWTVQATPLQLDPAFPEWGESRYCDVTLTGVQRVSDALSQLYVLLPVLDGSKHYWIDPSEVEKLLRAGEAWLPEHPDRELITRRYLGRRPTLVRSALARLAESDEVPESELDNAIDPEPTDATDRIDTTEGMDAADAAAMPTAETGTESVSGSSIVTGTATADAETGHVSLAVRRREAVIAALKDVGGRRVLDLGCGGGALLRPLLHDRHFTEIVGVDVSARALQYAARKLHLDRLPARVAERLTLKQGSLTYTDAALKGYDAAVLMEVIEHVDPPRLASLEHAVFGAARPRAVVVTTPNAEYNVRYETLEAGRMRHRDHRFEWTRAEFAAWADGVGERRGYSVEYRAVGDVDAELGAATQMVVFVEITGPASVQDAPSPTLPARLADKDVGDGVEEAK
jgi:SAM-dependent methyltransferase